MNYFVIALGNPGPEYATTVHNAGWVVMDKIVDTDAWREDKYAKSIAANLPVGDIMVDVYKPQTFMNESGQVVDYLIKEYDATANQLIIIYDDIDLPLGKIKISHDRGDGGHNGVKSIVEHLGSRAFTRIRVGVSHDLGDGNVNKPNVLKRLSSEQIHNLEEISTNVQKAIETIAIDGYESAMNQFNS
ncbi:MAG: aminoacyl-tRNA hydrolase [Candidatus Nomurabacteria bacterium]|nr:aminoacyl-tRNA hydrolase [Candidatus Nomurabacteria bacterium]